ncbi:MAG: glycosyl hydrolase [Chitinophagaceae bacterium]
MASLFCLPAGAQLQWPAVTQTAKPWTRWWWLGSAVDKKGLTWNLEQYRQAGLGGVEITPIYGIHGYENRFVRFLSPQWMQLLQHTLSESRRLGLGVDLANATGWPFGGPWVTDADASKTIYYKTYTMTGGERLPEPVEYRREAMVRTANNKPAGIDSILQPVAANRNLQALALDQVQYPGRLSLQSLMACSDGQQVLDLTNKVAASGKLDWVAPAGNWTLYALFQGLHGKMVERAAPGGEGYAIDHFSATAARNYFKPFDKAFKGHDLSYLRGFFNDSYEVDDAREQANWTPAFFEEFKKRKGYDLRNYLPALFGKDSADKSSRVIYDYRSVIDALILEDFTGEWKKWAAGKGKIVRNQSHGSPANTLDLYSVVDIPETEGNDILRFKFATSAANVTGKKLVSSESATWLNEHFLSSWGDVKKAIDLYFLGGVNHIFYHGTAYSPPDVPWPGWLFYAAVHFQPTNPQWKDFHVLNEYITRVQSFLQQGRPDNDILLYYPIADRYSEPGPALLQHFDGMENNFENTDFKHISEWMLGNGYSFDFFSDRQLQSFDVTGDKQIISGSNTYRCIVLPGNKYIPEESMRKLLALAEKGALVIFYNQLPADVPGWYDLDARRAKLDSIKNGLSFKNRPNGLKTASPGKGEVLTGISDIGRLLVVTGVRKERLQEEDLQFIRRRLGDTVVYFIVNSADKLFDGWWGIDGRFETVLLFNAMTGDTGVARSIAEDNWKTNIRFQLQPGESIIVKAIPANIDGPAYPYWKKLSPPVAIEGGWTLEFIEGGPVLPAKAVINQLGSWTELDQEGVKDFSGTAKYSIAFQKPVIEAPAYLLDLGKVNETAEVVINGKKIATLIGTSFQCIIPASALQSVNTLEIVVANLMANRIAYMDRNHLPWKIFYNTNMPARKRENVKDGLFDAAGWQPLPSGLSGPVTLTPVTVLP